MRDWVPFVVLARKTLGDDFVLGWSSHVAEEVGNAPSGNRVRITQSYSDAPVHYRNRNKATALLIAPIGGRKARDGPARCEPLG